MSRKDDTEILVSGTKGQSKISQRAVVACLVFGIAFISLLIYGFIIALDLKSRPHLNLPESNDKSTTSSKSCPDVEFDYLLLAVRWPISDCTEDQCVTVVPKRWLIHGLWPNYANGSWPQFCCHDTPFQEDSIRPVEKQLLQAWPNLLKHENESSLWKHEWNKHGTCATKNEVIRGELKYFTHTLNLFSGMNISDWLTSQRIVPGVKLIARKPLKSLLRSKWGRQVTIHCVKEGLRVSSPENTTSATAESLLDHSDDESSKTQNLESIHFCFDKTNIEPIDCPDHDNCPEEFLLPSHT